MPRESPSARQADPDVRPAHVAIAGTGAAPVRAGDRLDDRKAEPGPAPRPPGIGAAEPLEGPVEELGGEARAAVLDVELHRAVRLGCPHTDLPAAVLEGVLDHVGERLLDPDPVALHPEAIGGFDHELAVRRSDPGAETLPHIAEDTGESDRPELDRELALLGAGEDEEVLGERDQPIDLLDPGGDRGPHLLGRLPVAEGELELGLVHRKGRAELVAPVVPELPPA